MKPNKNKAMVWSMCPHFTFGYHCFCSKPHLPFWLAWFVTFNLFSVVLNSYIGKTFKIFEDISLLMELWYKKSKYVYTLYGEYSLCNKNPPHNCHLTESPGQRKKKSWSNALFFILEEWHSSGINFSSWELHCHGSSLSKTAFKLITCKLTDKKILFILKNKSFNLESLSSAKSLPTITEIWRILLHLQM